MNNALDFVIKLIKWPFKTKSRKIIFGIVVTLLVLAAAFIFIILQTTSTPKRISDTFLHNCLNGNIETAYYSTSKEFQEVTSANRFVTFCSDAKTVVTGDFHAYNRSIKVFKGSSDSTILYKLSGKRDRQYYAKVVLEKTVAEPKGWQVIYVDFSEEKYSPDR